MNINKLFATVMITIVTIYVAFVMIINFIQATPTFAIYGGAIIGALVFGAVAYFKYDLFRD
jgi:hypothetical protein